MLPLTLIAAQKVANLLTEGGALQTQISTIAALAGKNIPIIDSSQVVISSVSPDLADKDI